MLTTPIRVRMFSCALLFLLGVVCTSVGASDFSRVYILLEDEPGLALAEDIVSKWRTGEKSAISIEAIRSADIQGLGYVFHPNFRAYSNDESALRGRMARYMVASLPTEKKGDDLVAALAKEPDVLHAEVGSALSPRSSDDCAGGNQIRILNQHSKSWAQDITRVAEAHELARGHSYIGIIDLGIDQEHSHLKDFDGSTYLGGNFHRHLGVDIGGRAWDDTDGPNHPFGAAAIFGSVDEYNVTAVPGSPAWPSWKNCDDPVEGGDGDGYIQARHVGHGTHVSGLIAGQPLQAEGWRGACQNCPIQVVRVGNGHAQCNFGTQPFTNPPRPHEQSLSSPFDAWAGLALSVDSGVQVVNLSLGDPNLEPCGAQPSLSVPCMAISYAAQRDVMIFAAAGNENSNSLHFPANDTDVYGVAGIESSGNKWDSAAGCGSNRSGAGQSEESWPHLAAPAHMVYSTMYPNTNYAPLSCHVGNDGDAYNGFGYCTGTSMATPIASGIGGIVRSVMPLATRSEVFDAIRATTDRAELGLGRSNELGWGVPKADKAVEKMLGSSGFSPVPNRLTPLFSMYSLSAEDSLNTTKPQVAVAFANNVARQYTSYPATPLVENYSFPFTSEDPGMTDPRAHVFLLTTHVSPHVGYGLVPLYRMRYRSGPNDPNPLNQDVVLVEPNRLSAFKNVGYEMEGLEGYVYAPGGGAPPFTVKLWRAYNHGPDDHAIFPESQRAEMVSNGYNHQLTHIGYAYPNIDSDGDGLIDGMESILGTDPYSADSNCDGTIDSDHYPMYGVPVSDPLAGSCGADLELAMSGSNGEVEVVVTNRGNESSDGFDLVVEFGTLTDYVYVEVNHDGKGGAGLSCEGPKNTCPPGPANACSLIVECSVGPLSVGKDWPATFHVVSNKPAVLTAEGEVAPAGVVDDPDYSNNHEYITFGSSFFPPP